MISDSNIYSTQPGRPANVHPGVLASGGIAIPGKMVAKELHVFLWAAALPTREEWQAGITEHGFPLVLDETLDVRHHTGFGPVMYWGKKSGFEFNLCPAADIASRNTGISERIGTRGLSANFRWRGNALESVVVYIASAVLAKLSDGIVYYPQKNHFSTGHEAMATTRRLLAAIELS